MRVLLGPLHYWVSDRHGTELYWAYRIAKGLAAHGFDVTAIAGIDDCEVPLAPAVDLRTVMNGGPHPSALAEAARRFIFPARVLQESRRVLAQGKVDVIHHVLPFGPHTYNLLAVTGGLTAPLVLGPIMPPQRSMSHDDFCQWLGVRPGLTSRVTEAVYKVGTQPLKALSHMTLRRASRLICVSTEAMDFYSRWVPREKMALIPAGIDADRFIPGEQRPISDDPLRVLFVGYLIERKGLPVLLRALRYALDVGSRVVLDVVGDGSQRPEVERLSAELNLQEHVRWHGKVPFSQVQALYQQADVVANPTMYEPFGQVTVEAMACGLPVIGSAVGALPEIITPDTGVLFPAGDAQALATHLTDFSNNRHRLKTMGEMARRRVEEHYTWDAVIRQYIKIYAEVREEAAR